MNRKFTPIGTAAVALAIAAFAATDQYTARYPREAVARFARTLNEISIHRAARHDVSPRLVASAVPDTRAGEGDDAGLELAVIPPGALAPPGADTAPTPPVPVITAPAGSRAVEQQAQGTRPGAELVASFDGLGYGFQGPQGTGSFRNPSDNSLAVGPNHIVQIVNTRFAVYTKRGAMYDTTGKVLYGPVPTNEIFRGFGGACEARPNGDAVVRYDQLANRWLIVMPIFRRIDDASHEPAAQLPGDSAHYAMCYAVSQGPDPMGPYYRYEFLRNLFPDYPRPAVWPDGYYVPTSSGDNVIQKHACVADRARMLEGKDATEQCVIVDGVNFLNIADLDGPQVPAPGTPEIVMAAGGTQLHGVMEDSTISVWRLHVDWSNPALTKLTGPVKIPVAPYHYLCDGQLSSCVPQPGTTRRLDAQGDKLMARLTYRRIGEQQSIVAVHSVNTTEGAGGVRWYEFRLDARGDVSLYQQGTYAPDSSYRWMGSAAMDGRGDIGIGYSFGGTPFYAGQRFAGRLAGDPKGQLTLGETVLAEGQAAQTNTLRWEDYTQTAVDPSDDCTIWYVGDYYQKGAPGYSSRIGAFRMGACAR
ncbi:MAG TPA: hypothetical protein VFT41_01890 [Gemmatimonadaceae bacterium]|nr:hypothetical protein [Gemmatimonadaceae bacterium]